MKLRILLTLCALGAGTAAAAARDAADQFGARQAVAQAVLSPDGTKMAYVGPNGARGSAVYTVSVNDSNAPPVPALIATGDPERIGGCNWVSNKRLVCQVYGVMKDVELLPFSRLVAVDADGGNLKMLARTLSANSRGMMLGDGYVVDWLPDGDNVVLMARTVLPDDKVGSRVGSSKEGLGVDRVDTVTLVSTVVEQPRKKAAEYLSDGRGQVRVMGLRNYVVDTGLETGVYDFLYRKPGERSWEALSTYKINDKSGFYPVAVDPDKNIAYGFRQTDGRQALHSVALDGSGKAELMFARPDVDVEATVRIGRRNRVVGASFATDKNQVVYFDPELAALQKSLAKAIPNQPIVSIVDASVDEQRLLIWAGSDDDPGVYYLYDRGKKKLDTLDVVRPELDGQSLAQVTPVTFPAADGTQIPAYLTLPPGKTMAAAKGLKAIVLPHGGPSARDYWGFDWLSHYFAGQGYAVLRPNFRGSSGYGDAWFRDNGFKSWKVAIGDVVDGGRWMEKQGIAAPGKLGIVGWSYGGYEALQAAAVDPSLFRAVVAIAPVTDLARLKEESRGWSNFLLVSKEIGSGEHIREGSPSQNAERIKAPVLMFHGTFDRNVPYAQSTIMDSRLKAAGGQSELVSFDKLDHYLDDSAVRAGMLRKIDGFLADAGIR